MVSYDLRARCLHQIALALTFFVSEQYEFGRKAVRTGAGLFSVQMNILQMKLREASYTFGLL